MEAVARTTAPARLRTWVQPQPPAFAAWALGFLPVVYLSLRGGGWDPVIRNEVGIAVWWIVLIAAALGVIPLARVRTMGWVALALFAGFAVWTALGIGWSESGERTFAELSRVLTYLGVFALALAAQGRNLARPAVAGVASAIGLVAFLAVLSRLHPAWFPPNHVQEFFPGSARRLSYPLDSTNAVGSFMAVGLPALSAPSGSSRVDHHRGTPVGSPMDPFPTWSGVSGSVTYSARETRAWPLMSLSCSGRWRN